MKTSTHFTPLTLTGRNRHEEDDKFYRGANTFWGIPFALAPEEGNNHFYTDGESLKLDFSATKANYLVFMHSCETEAASKPHRGIPPIGLCIANYTICYTDGSRETIKIRCRYEIGDTAITWGESASLAQRHLRDYAIPTISECPTGVAWGASQFRNALGWTPLTHWLYAWENPYPERQICGVEVVHTDGRLYISGVTAAHVQAHPLRYSRRKKAVLPLANLPTNPLDALDIDLGQVISVLPRPLYDNWEQGHNNMHPGMSKDEVLVEYSSHEDAVLYYGEQSSPVSQLSAIPPAEQPVVVKVLGMDGNPTPVRIHAHGTKGEYLAPRNRHRQPQNFWFEDHGIDYPHGAHWHSYIDGRAEYLLPLGEVFFEAYKGFEYMPVRTRFIITAETQEIVIQLERVIAWSGWVSADTHTHFFSPHSALLEAQAEGVNVTNLLTTQWGEAFTNLGDFGAELVCGDHIVRVGSENRQRVMGHISLLGYDGDIILPLSAGGPDEAALADPVDATLTGWATRCRKQGGVNVIPHFPRPRLESAAVIVSNLADAVEMTSWSSLFGGIEAYALEDWYRYLNCGYKVALVGGTDKMYAGTALGTIRTYAKLNAPLCYTAWKAAVKAGRTFATYGALVDIQVNGKTMGETVDLAQTGKVKVDWKVETATMPVTAVDIIIGGEVVETIRFDAFTGCREGSVDVNIAKSTWAAVRVRGHYDGYDEIIMAHTSAVMLPVAGKRQVNAYDSGTILEQINCAIEYVTNLGTKATEPLYSEALSLLEAAQKSHTNSCG